MLTRFVRIQLAIFTIVGIIGMVVMVLWYVQAPTLLGHRQDDGHAGTARHRRAVPLQQRHLPRRADRQGDRVGLTPDGAKATLRP